MGDEPAPLTDRSVNRRAFLGAAVGAVALFALASCKPEPPSPTPTGRPVADDYAVELNAKIDAAEPGARVVIAKGASKVYSTIRLRSGVSLEAHPDGSTIVLADGTDTPFVLGAGVEDIDLVGIRFDGGVQKQAAVSLQLDGCSRIRIDRCSLVRMKHAVHVYSTRGNDSSDVTISSCDFDQITDFAVRIDPDVHDVEITGNTVRSVAKGIAPSPSAVYIRGRDVTVERNVVLGSYDTGVMAAGDAARNVTVEGNTLTTDMVAVYFGNGARSGSVRGNTLVSRRDFGIHVHDADGRTVDLDIRENTIGPTGKSGIQVEGVRDVHVVANTITDPARVSDVPDYWRAGVAVTTLKGHGAESILVDENVIAASGDGMESGVLLMDGTSNIIVTRNQITGAQAQPVQVDIRTSGPFLVEDEKGAVIDERGTTRRW